MLMSFSLSLSLSHTLFCAGTKILVIFSYVAFICIFQTIIIIGSLPFPFVIRTSNSKQTSILLQKLAQQKPPSTANRALRLSTFREVVFCCAITIHFSELYSPETDHLHVRSSWKERGRRELLKGTVENRRPTAAGVGTKQFWLRSRRVTSFGNNADADAFPGMHASSFPINKRYNRVGREVTYPGRTQNCSTCKFQTCHHQGTIKIKL